MTQCHSVTHLWMAKAEILLLSASCCFLWWAPSVVKADPTGMAQCVQACMWGTRTSLHSWVCTWKCPDHLILSKWLQNSDTPEFPLVSQKSPSKRQLDTWVWWGVESTHGSEVFPLHCDRVKGSLHLHHLTREREKPYPSHKIIKELTSSCHIIFARWRCSDNGKGRGPQSQFPFLSSTPAWDRKLPAIKGFARLLSHSSHGQGIREQMSQVRVVV